MKQCKKVKPFAAIFKAIKSVAFDRVAQIIGIMLHNNNNIKNKTFWYLENINPRK